MHNQFLRAVFASSAMQIFLGALLSAATTILLDWQKRPKLRFDIAAHVCERSRTVDPDGKVIDFYQGVGLVVTNLKRWPFRWPRQTLQRATAAVSFHDPHTGADIFPRSMNGRWASLPQPEIVFAIKGGRIFIGDQSLIRSVPAVDIPWGESEKLDIAAKFDGGDWAYGWSNENYYDPQHRYRCERWRIEQGRCLVKVVVLGSGEKLVKVFALVNGSALRLEDATRTESSLVLNQPKPTARILG